MATISLARELEFMVVICPFPRIKIRGYNLARSLYHGLKSVATICFVPTELSVPWQRNPADSEHAEPLGSVEIVAPDFNPGCRITPDFNPWMENK